MQAPLLALAALAVFDGLFGPQLAPKNLATVSVWLEFRGLAVLALLVAGNIFCMACPFMLLRQAARWLRERADTQVRPYGGRMVPAPLRGKWLAVGLVALFFYCYELFDLWASPWLTAWIIVGYFVVAFAIDAIFRGAAFCKYVCPLGQFNFFGSLISPLEVRIRHDATCAACRTKDCIAGDPARGARGCEMWLFQPAKAGNMDCTFCLDCVHACPYDNVGLLGRAPTSELWTDPYRSGIGRFSRRTDLAALVALFTFGAFVNALGMIRPVYDLQDALGRLWGATSQAPGLSLIFVLGLLVLPLSTVAGAAAASRRLSGRHHAPMAQVARRYVYALVPMGFGMWLAHYSFHFLSGGITIVPVVQSFLADIGLRAAQPRWDLGALAPAGSLFPIEALLLYLGAFGSIIVAFHIAQRDLGVAGAGARRAVLGALAPWLVLIVLLLGWGLWIMVQPMEMRGTMLMLSAPGGVR